MKMILATQKGKMKLIPVQMGQIFVLTIQIGLCVAKPKLAALIFFSLVAKMIFLSQGHSYLPLKNGCLYCLASCTLILGNISTFVNFR